MCGLAGILKIRHSKFEITESLLKSMSDTMAHRGPDDQGVWICESKQIGFSHRRLSIIDLSTTAAQPMTESTNSLTIVFNGEIYNHIELREELFRRGHREWKTDHSDTEVILKSFLEWGIDCVHKFRGMFSFAIWDHRTHELWLVRDRIGIKPMYYSLYKDRFSFGSEIKSLHAEPGRQKSVNQASMFHYLTFLVAPSPETMFEDIKKLPAGHWLKINSRGSIQINEYWSPLTSVSPLRNITEVEAVELVREKLNESVQLRKISDVDVGIFLSGGIDSSINTSLFTSSKEDPTLTFCVGYKGEFASYSNETQQARTVSEYFGTKHHEILLDVDQLAESMPEIIFHQDEPLADPVCLPVYFVSKLAHESGVTVCQVGEGADELFLGYPSWEKQLVTQNAVNKLIPTQLYSPLKMLMSISPYKRGTKYEYIRRMTESLPIFWGGANVFTKTEKTKMIGPDFKFDTEELDSSKVISNHFKKFTEEFWEPNPINWMTYMDLRLRLPELLLMRVDKMAMAHSLETRVPFLDHELVSLIMSIPSDIKYRPSNPKYLLKSAAAGLLPQSILDRPKQGFGLPMSDWLLEKIKPSIQNSALLFSKESGLLEWKETKKILESRDSARIWSIYNLSAWWNYHFGKAPSI